jgi:uncharacterized protein YegJ (DUF2314 family)
VASAAARRQSRAINTHKVVTADRQAQAGPSEFLALAAKPPTRTRDLNVQVMAEDSDGIGPCWVTHFRPFEPDFIGEVADEPRSDKGVTWGQQLRFNRAQSIDWGYIKNDCEVGDVSACARFKQRPAEQVASTAARMALTAKQVIIGCSHAGRRSSAESCISDAARAILRIHPIDPLLAQHPAHKQQHIIEHRHAG